MAPGDYRSLSDDIIIFTAGQMTASHTIVINQDSLCEDSPNENFFSTIALNSGQQQVNVVTPRAEITIDDSAEPECSKGHTLMLLYKCVCTHIHS